MRIALAQLNPIVGDIRGNTARIIQAVQDAKARGAQLVATPELAVIGYPPRDLLLKPAAIEQCARAVEAIAAASVGITTVVGYPERNLTSVGRPLHNAVAVVRDSQVVAKRFKSLLPTYDVFDETRYFEPGAAGESELMFLDGQALGLSICEDLWNDEQMLPRQLYHVNPIERLSEAGAQILINISASPFVLGKNDFRRQLFGHQAKRYGMPIVYVNQVGGNDELVFDGNSAVFDKQGRVIAWAKDFAEDLLVVDLDEAGGTGGGSGGLGGWGSGGAGGAGGAKDATFTGGTPVPREGVAAIHAALVLGLRDYMRKCGFTTVVLGLSGGIDSAVVGALAAEAAGPENVWGIALPSRFSSDHSKSDAQQLAENLGIHFRTIPIETAHLALEQTLAPLFAGTAPGLAEENMQARIRGNLLMALSNKFGHLLLTTGNKSEVATGYCTLYGDMCGGLAVISDVPKMMVYELARYINAQAKAARRVAIPESSITKPPSAELRPNQTDQDSLPPYEILDAILQRYVEEEKSTAQIIAEGFDAATVARVVRLVDLSEYKRKQMPPGLKVTSRAFGFGRRMPIAQRYDPRVTGM